MEVQGITREEGESEKTSLSGGNSQVTAGQSHLLNLNGAKVATTDPQQAPAIPGRGPMRR